jgi:deoxyribonuclease IV
MPLLFGTAGIPHSAKKAKPEDGVRECARLGLGCMELEFVYGVKMTSTGAAQVSKAREETSLALTAHGPYYINLASMEPEKLAASRKRVLDTARIGFQCGARSITFHAAFFQGRGREEVLEMVAGELKAILETLAKEKIKIDIRPELSGKPVQVGSLEDLIWLGKNAKGILPTIDFAHFYARDAGARNNYKDFCGVLEQLGTNFGKAILKNMHIHISGIEFTAKGERKHLNFSESGFNWKDCLKALLEYDVEGVCICESPSLEGDALLLKDTYKKLSAKGRMEK